MVRVPPVVTKPTPEAAVYVLNWLSATGTGILIAAIIAGLVMGMTLPTMIQNLRQDAETRAVLAADDRCDAGARIHDQGCGLDSTLGLAFAHAGWLYPVLRRDARLAGRRADRLRHVVERVVRGPAADLGRAARALARCSWRLPTARAASWAR